MDWFVLIPVETMWTLQQIFTKTLKDPTGFYEKHHDDPMKGCWLYHYNENRISSTRRARFYEKNTHLYTIICQSM